VARRTATRLLEMDQEAARVVTYDFAFHQTEVTMGQSKTFAPFTTSDQETTWNWIPGQPLQPGDVVVGHAEVQVYPSSVTVLNKGDFMRPGSGEFPNPHPTYFIRVRNELYPNRSTYTVTFRSFP
jgi:hypothetical protein